MKHILTNENITDFQRFKNRVKKCGGIWKSNDVYFNQSRDGYTALYSPKYPKHSVDDYILFESWIKKEISLYAPFQATTGIIKRFENWNEVWKNNCQF